MKKMIFLFRIFVGVLLLHVQPGLSMASQMATAEGPGFVLAKNDAQLDAITKRADKTLTAKYTANQQQEIKGKVVDQTTGKALAAVTIRVKGAPVCENK